MSAITPSWLQVGVGWVVRRDSRHFRLGCALRKLKGAQCSEPVKSRMCPAYGLYEKTKIFYSPDSKGDKS